MSIVKNYEPYEPNAQGLTEALLDFNRINLFFDMLTEYVWWIKLGLSVPITTAIYYTIKYMVDWLHQI